jgi:hypothetical protein
MRTASCLIEIKEKHMTIHRNLIAAAIASLIFCAALPAVADEVVPADQTTTTTTVVKHRYVYYPEHEIYFAPESKTYYWRVNGNWISGTMLPQEDMPYIRTHGVSIELDTDRPYTRHDYVISHYKIEHREDSDRDKDR